MTSLVTNDALEGAVPAPAPTRPVHVSDMRPWDRIAFRVPQQEPAAQECTAGPQLVWPSAVIAELPDPAAWCGALVRTCVEVLLGARPAAQLSRWLTTELYASVSRRATVGQSLPATPRRVQVLRVHTCEIDEAHYEASVVLHDGRRVRAAAVRIEIYRGRWRATALEIG